MKALDFIKIAKDIATKNKTLYVMGCFGSPLNDRTKKRFTTNHSYNRRPERTAKIMAASNDTFGFDCVCLIKGILWGWNGNLDSIYGGAIYGSNGVPDTDADSMMNFCTDVSTDFSNIEPGEVVHMNGHIGIYIGDGLAVESTPIWKDGVQITAVRNLGFKEGYHNRTWVNHGKLKFIDYSKPEPPALKYKVGDRVIITGKLYSSSNAEDAAGFLQNEKNTEITRVNPGSKHPYNTTGDLGWMDEEDITLYIAPPKPELKVGDHIVIIGPGNGNSYGTSNKAYGIGWEREILNIYKDRPYPYQIGNASGTTGFYKEDSIEKQ